MSLHADLLEQALHLVHRERRRPRQASLRRAVSTAYYAIFHLLIDAGSSRLIGVPELRDRFTRVFDHGDMKQASRAFVNPPAHQLAGLTGGAPVPAPLQDVAATFVELQEARHDADYNTSKRFTRLQVVDLIARAQQAFQSWHTVRHDPVASIYLAALLIWRKWNR